MNLSKEDQRKEKRIKWLKYRWEFLRRNPAYKDIYEKNVERLRKQAKYSPDNFQEIGSKRRYLYLETKEADIERKYCKQFGLPSQCLIDPEKSFDDLIQGSLSMEKVGFWPSTFWEIWGKWTQSESHVMIDIDFAVINSIEALKEEAGELIEFLYVEFYKKYDKKYYPPVSDIKKREADFEIILQAGDMRTGGLKLREIAEKIYPDDFDPENENENPESAIKLIDYYCKQYKKLVGGGYKALTYP